MENNVKLEYYRLVTGSGKSGAFGIGVTPFVEFEFSVGDQPHHVHAGGSDGIDALCNGIDKFGGIQIPKESRRLEFDPGNSKFGGGNGSKPVQPIYGMRCIMAYGGKDYVGEGQSHKIEGAVVSAYIDAHRQIPGSILAGIKMPQYTSQKNTLIP